MSFENSQQDTAEQLLELAMRSGAEAVEVFQSYSLSRPVFFEANRLKQLESSQAEGVALRLLPLGHITTPLGHLDGPIITMHA